MDGDGNSREVEVVKKHWKMVMKAPSGREVEVERSAGDALDSIVVVRSEGMLGEPQFRYEL